MGSKIRTPRGAVGLFLSQKWPKLLHFYVHIVSFIPLHLSSRPPCTQSLSQRGDTSARDWTCDVSEPWLLSRGETANCPSAPASAQRWDFVTLSRAVTQEMSDRDSLACPFLTTLSSPSQPPLLLTPCQKSWSPLQREIQSWMIIRYSFRKTGYKNNTNNCE